jgi:GTP cyclohydrolase IA
MYKSDIMLGEKVRAKLEHLGLETPMFQRSPLEPKGPYRGSVADIEKHMVGIMVALGLDLEDDSLRETPKRVADMFVNEIFSGLDYGNFPKATVVDNKFKYNEMLLERNIIVNSTCEHHFLPIIGSAHVAYIPNEKVLGLSKLNRIADFFSRRPQIQERLVCQIFETLKFILGTDDVAICVAAEHMCVKTRGVKDACSDTVTSKLGGRFLDIPVRAEFYSMIGLQK